MRLPVRGKLILFVVLPILLIFLVASWIILTGLRTRLETQARQDTARLATYYAAELEGRFNTVAQIALATAAHLEARPGASEDQLYEMIRRNVEQHPLVFGGAIAFQPHAYRTNLRLFSPYVCRDGQGGLRHAVYLARAGGPGS